MSRRDQSDPNKTLSLTLFCSVLAPLYFLNSFRKIFNVNFVCGKILRRLYLCIRLEYFIRKSH